jgi:hypothetical protein
VCTLPQKHLHLALAPSALTYHAPSSPNHTAPCTATRALHWQLAVPVAHEQIHTGVHGKLEEAWLRGAARRFVSVIVLLESEGRGGREEEDVGVDKRTGEST